MQNTPMEHDGPIVTLVHLTPHPQAEEALLSTYQELTPRLLAGTPEFKSSLLAANTDPANPEAFVILSYWSSQSAYQEWEAGEHRKELRPIVRLVESLRPETFVCVG